MGEGGLKRSKATFFLLGALFGCTLLRIHDQFRNLKDSSAASITKGSNVTAVEILSPNNTRSYTRQERSDPFLSPSSPFLEAIERFDWDSFSKKSLSQLDEDSLWQDLVSIFVEINALEPLVPVNETCASAPPLTIPTEADCRAHESAFSEQTAVRNTPRTAGHAIIYGFDVDTLEIHLQELYDVVDYFFILEWTESHNPFNRRKVLNWDRLKLTRRFRPFLDKVVHLVMDDVDTAQLVRDISSKQELKDDLFAREHFQEWQRWKKIFEWNQHTEAFGEDDLIGFGDADEVPSRYNVQLLKYCEKIEGDDPVDIGIWFPYGNLETAYLTDFHVPGYPYSHGDPTFYLWSRAVEKSQDQSDRPYPSRERGTSQNHLLGGMHMSHGVHLTYQFLKRASCTECSTNTTRDKLKQGLLRANNAANSTGWRELECQWGRIPRGPLRRSKSLDMLNQNEAYRKQMELIVYIPWFLDCNRDRYPAWEGRPDSRFHPAGMVNSCDIRSMNPKRNQTPLL